MRISDWSSDVCSSVLDPGSRAGSPPGLLSPLNPMPPAAPRGRKEEAMNANDKAMKASAVPCCPELSAEPCCDRLTFDYRFINPICDIPFAFKISLLFARCPGPDRKTTRLTSSHQCAPPIQSSAFK